jgi:DNA polymerase I
VLLNRELNESFTNRLNPAGNLLIYVRGAADPRDLEVAVTRHGVAPQHWLVGCDPLAGIVSVDANTRGQARIWRRLPSGQVESTPLRFRNWFLSTNLDLVAHLPARHVTAAAWRAAHGALDEQETLTVVELDVVAGHEDSYRYLVLASSLDDVEIDVVETANKRDGGEAQSLADLRGLVLVWSPIEQFLIASGLTYFKGLAYEDLRRMQFDLETTGLDDERDRIFMISMRDSGGWRECLETSQLGEPQLLRTFVELVHDRDPDVLENHNIFGFDLSFLVRRAARLGVGLGLGRDGSEPTVETDIFDNGERMEPFLRWRIIGREVIDTQHAVRRFSLAAPDLRRHGLKDAARYFGFARADREYVAGADVWPTYQHDPERIRRYAADDVDEVDGLSRRLLPSVFELARRLPRAYERIAADCGAASLWEPLLVRAYLHEGWAIPAPAPRQQPYDDQSPAELLIQGVLGPTARAHARPLLPRVLASAGIRAANDSLDAFPRVLEALLEADDAEPLVQASHTYLAGGWLLSDPDAAAHALLQARQFVTRLLGDLRGRGCRIVEIDGEHVMFTTPADWDSRAEALIAADAEGYLPRGVRVYFDGHYKGVYARAARSAILLAADDSVTLVGSVFRAGRLERYGEHFLRAAAPHVVLGNVSALRQAFVSTVDQLRSAQIPLDDLCVQATLHKSPAEYRRLGVREEPYEVLLNAGVRSWRVGQRIRYFRAHHGEPQLLAEGDLLSPREADTEFYVQRLSAVYCQQFAQAFRREDFLRIFAPPDGHEPELVDIGPIAQPV